VKALSQNQARVLRAFYRLVLEENCKPICIAAAAQKMQCWSGFVTNQRPPAIDETCPAALLASYNIRAI
jgi:hypothetical protein